jgi:uncharacterized glyoxalase superfamily protein PhnB
MHQPHGRMGAAAQGFGRVGCSRCPTLMNPLTRCQFTGSFYFHHDEVDELWQQIKDKAMVVYPLEDFGYGMREFAIRDNNGYILQFGQEI